MLILNAKTTDREMISVPWDEYFIEKRVTAYLDESDEKIINAVAKVALLNREHGKFSDMPIGIGLLSEGCKTLLCINHAIKTGKIDSYIFNITSCGGNAITYLATEMATKIDIYAFIEHGDFGYFENCKVMVNNTIVNSSSDAVRCLIKFYEERGGLSWY